MSPRRFSFRNHAVLEAQQHLMRQCSSELSDRAGGPASTSQILPTTEGPASFARITVVVCAADYSFSYSRTAAPLAVVTRGGDSVGFRLLAPRALRFARFRACTTRHCTLLCPLPAFIYRLQLVDSIMSDDLENTGRRLHLPNTALFRTSDQALEGDSARTRMFQGSSRRNAHESDRHYPSAARRR